MNVELSPALERYVTEQVKEGRYLDAPEVVREAVRRMEAARPAAAGVGTHLGGFSGVSTGDDIMAMAFAVMREAATSAREDLKAIMDGVKAINEQKAGWREVANTLNAYAAAAAGKPDDFAASQMGSAIPRGPASSLQGKPVGAGTLDRDALLFNMPGSNGATVTGGFSVQGTGTQDGMVTKKDIDNAKETVKNKLDSLSEMGEMESLRLQMAMDRMSKMMSTLSNLLKKVSDTASDITQNIK
jgi:Arc/MetJ-type ribon-helix-helix transcriptional regulator